MLLLLLLLLLFLPLSLKLDEFHIIYLAQLQQWSIIPGIGEHRIDTVTSGISVFPGDRPIV